METWTIQKATGHHHFTLNSHEFHVLYISFKLKIHLSSFEKLTNYK